MMDPVPLGAGALAVEEVSAEVDVVVAAWVAAAPGQVRVANVPVLPVVRGCHIGPGCRAMRLPVPSVGPKW